MESFKSLSDSYFEECNQQLFWYNYYLISKKWNVRSLAQQQHDFFKVDM